MVMIFIKKKSMALYFVTIFQSTRWLVVFYDQAIYKSDNGMKWPKYHICALKKKQVNCLKLVNICAWSQLILIYTVDFQERIQFLHCCFSREDTILIVIHTVHLSG